MHELWVHTSIPPCPAPVSPFVADGTVRESLDWEIGSKRDFPVVFGTGTGENPVSKFPTDGTGMFPVYLSGNGNST